MTDTRFATILKRGVAEIITEAELLRLLDSGRTLILKQGFDPSAPDIHLGHVVGLRKLRQFQELGHKVTLIVGDWTARIGDPSGQSATRPMLSPTEIENNAQTYMEQFFKVVDKEKTELRWQSEWFSQFTLDEVIKLTSKFTVAQLLAREDFNRRYSSGNPISLTEMLYPLLQGYDSVAIKADVEFGGIDQKFNCLLGRELQQSTGQPPQQVFLVPLLVGTDGKQKMSKSLNNHIGIAEPPREMYGKMMSIPDHLIVEYFELVTDVPEEEIAEFGEQLKTHSVNPMNLKKRLAHEIVRQFHGKQAADEAQEHFTQVFQKRETPEETRTAELRSVTHPSARLTIEVQRDITILLVETGLAKSRSEANRLLTQGAIEVDGEKVNSNLVTLKDGSVIKVGKRRFLRMVDSMKRKQETTSF
ncbi:MAG TPA: tyrosine--tRNA ligase [Chloroflexi bacterium]|mgnify:CR=1 FL=1|nr:tyrosine--tRNA ligase [Chloroflexota bacterium]